MSTKRRPPRGRFGDVNGDGYVTAADSQAAARHYYGIELYPNGQLTPAQFIRADVNGDGEVTMEDAALIQSYVDGNIDTFTVCEGYIEPTKDIPWLLIGAAIILLYLLTRG